MERLLLASKSLIGQSTFTVTSQRKLLGMHGGMHSTASLMIKDKYERNYYFHNSQLTSGLKTIFC